MLTQQLSDHWAKLELRLSGANSPETVTRFEAQWQVTMPADLRDYFIEIGGMVDWEIEGETLFCFWPLDKVIPLTEFSPELPPEKFHGYFGFADQLLYSHVYAINLQPESPRFGSIVTYHHNDPIDVVPSFTEFVRIYLSEADRLIP